MMTLEEQAHGAAIDAITTIAARATFYDFEPVVRDLRERVAYAASRGLDDCEYRFFSVVADALEALGKAAREE